MEKVRTQQADVPADVHVCKNAVTHRCTTPASSIRQCHDADHKRLSCEEAPQKEEEEQAAMADMFLDSATSSKKKHHKKKNTAAMAVMSLDSDRIAEYLTSLRPSAPLFALIKFRLRAHALHAVTGRWLILYSMRRIPKPPREQRACMHCIMQAIQDEQHFLSDCHFYGIIREQHFSLFGPNYQQRDIGLSFEQNARQLGFVTHHIHLCFQARMSNESHLAPHPRM